jgi:hypothetical protein
MFNYEVIQDSLHLTRIWISRLKTLEVG